jgi:glycosyltransferase involved in cell wall biosynthesis
VSGLTTLGLRSFEQLFPKEKPDILFLPNNGHVGIPTIPYGLVVHDLSFLVEPTWFNRRGQIWHKIVHARRVMTQATRLFAVSDWTKFALMLHLGIPSEKIDVLQIPRHTDLVAPGPLPEVLRGKHYVLCLGRQDRRKNASCVIEAVKRLHTKPNYADVCLVIVGGHFKPLHDPRFIVLPRVSDETLNALYQGAAAFLYPSWYEGLGLPLHEAYAFGTPSISASTTALPDTAPPGTLFAPPSKPHLWMIAIQTILDRTQDMSAKPQNSQINQPADWKTAVAPIRTFLLKYKKS